jgi:hypothetical protein
VFRVNGDKMALCCIRSRGALAADCKKYVCRTICVVMFPIGGGSDHAYFVLGGGL